MPLPFRMPDELDGPVVATAVHAGHDLRAETQDLVQLDEAVRLREEDPFTDQIADGVGSAAVACRSRFEVDLNRPRESAVYRHPSDCWDLDVWDGDLPDDVVDRSLQIYDDFYRSLADRLDPLAEAGPFVVFDVHSYNHRRDGAGSPPLPAADNPDVNLGTGSMDRERWAPVVEALAGALGATAVGGKPLDVRENVRFRGANLAAWVHERYPDRGCAVAIEFKKTFMDEWTGELDQDHLLGLRAALRSAVPAVEGALDRVPA